MAINEAEKEKKGHINTTPIDLGLEMYANILHIKRVSV